MTIPKINVYAHFLFSLALIPAILYGNVIIKGVIMGYAGWLVIKGNAGYLPALVVLSSFLTNPYVIYFSIIILVINNYWRIKIYGVHKLLFVLLFCLPYIIFHTLYLVLVLKFQAAMALNQFYLFFPMFSFFYGLILCDTFDRKTTYALILSLIVLFFIHSFQIFFLTYVRLFFYIIPFFSGYAGYYLFSREKRNVNIFFLIGMFILISVSIISRTTFTIYLTSIFSFIICGLYFFGRRRILIRITGISTFILVFVLLFYAILDSEKNDYSQYMSMEMTDINSTESLTNRIKMKLFDDRGPIWRGVWERIVLNKEWLPADEIRSIELVSRSGDTQDFAFHSHNLYLELVRTSGIIIGVITSVVFIIFALLGRKIFSLKNIDPILIIFVSASISTMILGSLTGIYVLLSTYATLSLTILGISYATYKIRHESEVRDSLIKF